MVVNRSVTKVFRTSAFKNAVERVVQQRLAKPYVSNEVSTYTSDCLGFTVSVAIFVRTMVEYSSNKKARSDRYRIVSKNSVVRQKTKVEAKFSPQKTASERIPTPPTDLSDDTEQTSTCKVALHVQMIAILAITTVVVGRKRAGTITVADTIPPQHLGCVNEIFPIPAYVSWSPSAGGIRRLLTIDSTISYRSLNGMVKTSHPRVKRCARRLRSR